jgi:hypothetical protein
MKSVKVFILWNSLSSSYQSRPRVWLPRTWAMTNTKPRSRRLRRGEVMLRLKCDVHPWMIGFLGIKSHLYFAVTADGGKFRIDNVPAGTYTLQAWQEKLGTVDQSIEVEDGETVTVEFAYGGEESASVQPSMSVRTW